MLAAQRHDQLLVRLLLARLVEHAHVGLATVERLARFAQTAGQAVVDERRLQDALERVEHRHAAGLAVGGIGGDFDFVCGLHLFAAGVGGLFSVRLLGDEGVSWGL